MPNQKYPSALFWIDIETTQLPPSNDQNNYDDVHILEIGVIVTDYDLKPYFGYQGIVQLDDAMKASLKNNPEVFKMHLDNGLLKESKESTDTLRIIESEIIGMLKSKTTQEKGEFMIAGSGVATFDLQVLKAKMPELASWLVYYPFDIGVNRRVAKILSGGRDLVSPIKESFDGAVKKHRALDDIKAHLKEALEWQKFYKWALDKQTEA
jgi:oligoribonuclease (3'-5' exoribonuclease)